MFSGEAIKAVEDFANRQSHLLERLQEAPKWYIGRMHEREDEVDKTTFSYLQARSLSARQPFPDHVAVDCSMHERIIRSYDFSLKSGEMAECSYTGTPRRLSSSAVSLSTLLRVSSVVHRYNKHSRGIPSDKTQ